MITETEMLITWLQDAYRRKSWHGTTLRGSLRGLDLDTLTWRAGEGRHAIWELALHAAYWKHAVTRQLLGGPRGSFPKEGSNWFPAPEAPSLADWKRDLALLDRMHQDLLAAVEGLAPEDLDRPSTKGGWRWRDLVQGVAAHDLYHAGQIQLLKRLRQG